MDLAQTLTQQAARVGAAPALMTAAGAVTYAELETRVEDAAAALRRQGLVPGDRLGLLLGNRGFFVEAVYGAWRAGLAAVPLEVPVEDDASASELGAVLAHSGAAALVTDARGVRATEGLDVDVLEVSGGWDALGGGGGSSSGPDVPHVAPNGADELAMLAYTSGTSGRARGAMLSHANLAANHRQLAGTRQGVTEHDVVLGALPMSHAYGLNVALTFTLARGGCVVLVEDPDPAAALELVTRHRVSVLPAVPRMYRAWLDADADGGAFGSVRIAVSGGAPLDPALAAAFRERYDTVIWPGYGLTEAGPAVTTTTMGHEPLPGSVGWPLPGVQVRLRDEHGRPVASGDLGEVQVRGDNVFAGYWDDEAATAAAFDADGWLRTGDIGYAQEGQLHLVGRRDERIVVRGFNVYPREVEEVLLAHPSVTDAAVVGVSDESAGEAVKAVVVTSECAPITSDELLEHCRKHLAGFKRPQELERVDALPLTRHGKVLRRRLRRG